MAKLKFHPASDQIPLLDGEEYQSLRSSLREHGYLEEFGYIWTIDGKIVEGRNRYTACLDEDIDPGPNIREYDGPLTPSQFMLAANTRRNLEFKKRIQIFAKLMEAARAEAKERQKAGVSPKELGHLVANLPEGSTGRSRDTGAHFLGVSPRTAQHVINVLDNGATEVVDAMSNGHVSPSDAAAVVDKPKETQKKAVEKVRTGKARTLKEAAKPEPKPEELKDEIGRVVPKELVTIFAEADKFDQAINLINKVKRDLRELAEGPAGSTLKTHIPNISIDLDNAKRTIRFDRPYAVCPVCEADDKKRTKKRFKELGLEWDRCCCRGSGWITESALKVLPVEVRP